MKQLGLAILFVICFSIEVLAHSWYPWICCSDNDCAPVTSVIMLEGGKLEVVTKHGIAVVNEDFERKESQDSRMHACMRYDPSVEQMILICFFVPPGN
jgi:hypothetical protein